jgi:acyl carrier protein
MTARLTEAEVFATVQAAAARVLELDPATITPDSAFVDDLGADSLALVEVVELVEEALAPRASSGFRIDDDDLEQLHTVGAAVAYALARLGPTTADSRT